MKIAIPAERNEGLSSKVFGHFGSAPFFAIYEEESKAVEVGKSTKGYVATVFVSFPFKEKF